MKRLMMACVLFMLAACGTTTKNQLATGLPTKPAPGAKILVMQPDVQLAILTAGGTNEPRADWSNTARNHLLASISANLQARSLALRTGKAEDIVEGRAAQLLRLHDAVGQSILSFKYGVYKLPTKKDAFDWTLGSGAAELHATYDADYALFVTGRGSYASGGRIAANIALAMLGVGVPLGSQQVFASLVDLRTGNVIWFNVANVGSGTDIREAAGAQALTQDLLAKAPL